MRGNPVPFTDFSGGLNSKDAVYSLAPNEARECLNVISTDRGAIRKRNGCSTFAAPSSVLHSLFAMRTPDYLLAAGGTSLYRIDTGGVVTTFAAGLLSAGVRWEWVQASVSGTQGPVYGMNGTDTPRYFTGSASGSWTASSGTLPNGKYLLWRNNRVWVAGDATHPSRLYWSDVLDPRVWPANNYLDLDADDGNPITGIGSVGSYILVFKEDKAWIVYDLDTGANRRLTSGVGCVSHRSIAETPKGTFFLTRDQGVMSVDESSSVTRISDRITPTINDVHAPFWQNASAVYFNQHYYLAAAVTANTNDRVFDFDTQTGAWWVHNNPVADWGILPIVAQPYLFSVDAISAYVNRAYLDGALQDNGNSITAYWKGPFHTFGTQWLRKRVRQVHFDGSGRVEVGISKNFTTAADVALDFTFATDTPGVYGSADIPATVFGVADGTIYGGLASVADQHLYTLGVARAWSVIFGNATADPFEVDSYTFAITPRTS